MAVSSASMNSARVALVLLGAGSVAPLPSLKGGAARDAKPAPVGPTAEPVGLVSLSSKAQHLVLQLHNDRLQATGPSGARVENAPSAAEDGGIAKTITTGNGNDTVDLVQTGGGRTRLNIDTNAGDDNVSMSFTSRINDVYLFTGDGADTVRVTNMGSGVVNAGAGDDVIEAHNSGGFINGGAGNDTVTLSFDADGPHTARISKFSRGVDAEGNASTRARYVERVGVTAYGFSKGDGHDIVRTQRSLDASEPADLYFGGLTSKDVSLTLNAGDLVFTVNSTKETLTIKEFDKEAWYQVQFAGEAWNLSDLMSANGIQAA